MKWKVINRTNGRFDRQFVIPTNLLNKNISNTLICYWQHPMPEIMFARWGLPGEYHIQLPNNGELILSDLQDSWNFEQINDK